MPAVTALLLAVIIAAQAVGDLYVANIRSNEVTVYDGRAGAAKGTAGV